LSLTRCFPLFSAHNFKNVSDNLWITAGFHGFLHICAATTCSSSSTYAIAAMALVKRSSSNEQRTLHSAAPLEFEK